MPNKPNAGEGARGESLGVRKTLFVLKKMIQGEEDSSLVNKIFFSHQVIVLRMKDA